MPDLVPTHLHDVIRALKGDRLQPPGDYSIGGQWHMYPPGSEMEKDPLNPPPAPPPTPGFPPASDWMHDKVGQGLFGMPSQQLQQMSANTPPPPKPPPQPVPGVNSLIDWGSSDKLAPMTPP